jgi:hypothetical protein
MSEERIEEEPTTTAEVEEGKEEGPISSVEVDGQSDEREEGLPSTDITDKQISIGEVPVIVPQEEKLQEQSIGIEQVQEKPIISKGKPKRRINSYLSNISKQVEKHGNQINKMTMMIQSLFKQGQAKSISNAGVVQSQFQSIKQIKSQISQLQKQVTRIQNDVRRIGIASTSKSKSKKVSVATAKPSSRKSKSLKSSKGRKSRRHRHR